MQLLKQMSKKFSMKSLYVVTVTESIIHNPAGPASQR